MTNIKTFQLVVSASMYVAASSHSADKNYVNSVTLAEAVDWGEIEELGGNAGKCQLQKKSTCTVEHPLSACHPIAYFPLSNPSFHFSVDYCCSNNSKCSASLS